MKFNKIKTWNFEMVSFLFMTLTHYVICICIDYKETFGKHLYSELGIRMTCMNFFSSVYLESRRDISQLKKNNNNMFFPFFLKSTSLSTLHTANVKHQM